MAILSSLVLALVAVTAFNLLLLFAVLRRLREAERRSVRPLVSAPTIGRVIGKWQAELTDGTIITDADLVPNSTLVFLSPGCGPCESLVAQCSAEPERLPAPAIAFVVGDAEDLTVRHYGALLPKHVRVAHVRDADVFTVAFGDITAFPTVVAVRGGVVVASGHSLDDLRVLVP